MAPPKKPKKVGQIAHQRSGITVDILLEPHSLQFSAEWGEQRFFAKTAEELKAIVYKAINESFKVKWESAIEITVRPWNYAAQRQGDQTAEVRVSISRFHWGFRANDVLVRTTDWESAELERLAGAHPFQYRPGRHSGENPGAFRPPCKSPGYEESTFYLPYTEETWAGLLALIEAMHKLRDRLFDLVGSAEGIEAIAAVGAGLFALPAPASNGKGEGEDEDE